MDDQRVHFFVQLFIYSEVCMAIFSYYKHRIILQNPRFFKQSLSFFFILLYQATFHIPLFLLLDLHVTLSSRHLSFIIFRGIFFPYEFFLCSFLQVVVIRNY